MAYTHTPYVSPHQKIVAAIDIETMPLDSAEVRAEIADSIKPSAAMTKPETIAAWERDRKPALVEEAFARGGLSAVTGRICCIGIVHGTNEKTFCGEDEAELLHLAYEYLSTLGDFITYVGHNLVGFDLPFLRHRSIVLRRRPPLSLRKAMAAKPWETEVVADTMLQWSHDKDKRISLDKLCRLLGIPSPKADGVDGSQVWPLWQAGERQKIADYCLADCRAALAVYQRIMEVA